MAEEATARYTVDHALLGTGFGKFQCLVLIYAGMGWISEAMEMMLLSFVGPTVKSQWHLTPQKESLISSVVFAGMLVGAYSWGLISDRFGRRRGFLGTAIMTSGAGVLSALAPNYVALLICRCLVGLGLGGGPVLFAWFLEFVPAPKRGLWMVIFSAFWTIGAILEAGLAWIVMPRLNWRWLLGISAVPSFLLLVFYALTPESPRYLCLKGRKNEALKILEKLAQLNGKQLPPGTLVSDHELRNSNSSLPLNNLIPAGANTTTATTTTAATYNNNKDEINGPSMLAPPQPNSNKDYDSRKKCVAVGIISSFLQLLSPKLLRSTLLLWVVFFANAFSYYGLVLLTTELSNNSDNHCNSSSSNAVNKPPKSGGGGGVNYKDVFIASFAEFPGYILSALTVDRLGRRISMAATFLACSIFLLPLVVHQSSRVTTALLFLARTCISSSFTVVYIYAPEIYPTSIRTTGMGVASAMGRIGGMLCPLVAVSLVQGCRQSASIGLFVGVIIAAGISVFLFPFETKGRELTDTVSNTKIENQLP